MPPATRFATTSDGVRLGYCVHGKGPPLLFVRGWLSHIEGMWEIPAFRSFVECLAHRFTVVRYDTRGQGVSTREIDAVDLDAFLRDIDAVVEHLDLHDIVLWGQTYGAPIAIAYTARHPDRVHRLILDGGYARGTDVMPAERREHFLSTVADMWPDSLSLLSHFTNPDPTPVQDSPQRRSWARRTMTGEVAALLYGFAFTVDVTEELERVPVEALVMHRRGSRAIPVGAGRHLASSIPDASFVALEGSAHNSWEGDAAQTLDAVSEFLGTSFPRPAPLGQTRAPVALLFTDIERSTEFTSRLGDERAQNLVYLHDQIVQDHVEVGGGEVVRHTGDGILAAFPSVSASIQAAVGIQRDLARREAPFRLRIGIDAGEPLRQGGELSGTVVQSARRIVDRAQPGTILVSDVVTRLVAGASFEFVDRGRVSLKGIREKVRLFEVPWRDKG